tara:strand:- start:12297 stop:12848 length:552 start_codon:yes stop_codon:yes gene_type:complete
MGLVSDLTGYFSEAGQAPNAAAQQTNKATELVSEVIGPWILKGKITAQPGVVEFGPLSYNPAGLPLVIQGMMSPPVPTTPTPGQLLLQQGVTLLFALMPFPMGTPYLPGAITNTGPNISVAPAVPFIVPPAPPGMPPAGIAQLWATNLIATAASVVVNGIDLFPGAPPIPTPFVLPFIPAPPD